MNVIKSYHHYIEFTFEETTIHFTRLGAIFVEIILSH